jgi:hypothetical protein
MGLSQKLSVSKFRVLVANSDNQKKNFNFRIVLKKKVVYLPRSFQLSVVSCQLSILNY